MEDVRQLVQEEGREARNLVAFHVAVDLPARVCRKPPLLSAPRRPAPRAPRLRSASCGRDKRSELRARYWALLFGDLQRAVGEIYNTVEAHENLNECQEVILVLENYTRDFRALGEWFRLKWEYDNTPPPQRPQSLAWEIRKTDFVRPESRRAHSVRSSPSVSGKNSPCLSGHNTPSGKNSPVTGKVSPGSGKISPRVTGHASTSPKANVEFFSNKIASKIATRPEPKSAKETPRLSDIKEKDIKENIEDDTKIEEPKALKQDEEIKPKPLVETGKAKECANVVPKPVIFKSPIKRAKGPDIKHEELSTQAKTTASQLDAMENEFLAKQITENQIKNDNTLNKDRECDKPLTVETLDENPVHENMAIEKENSSSVSPEKSEDNFGDVSNDSSPISSELSKTPEGEKEEDSTPLKVSDDSIKDDTKNDHKTKNDTEDIDCITEKTILDCPKNIIECDKSDLQKVQTNKTEIQEDKVDDVKKIEECTNKVEVKTNVEVKPSSRPAYSTAAAKPKQVTAKPDVKPKSATPIVRSKTVFEMNNAPKSRQFPKRNQISKCSYPFNLTTGRTSLFDTSASKVVVKKPMGKNPQLASGDTKILHNKAVDNKKLPRATPLKMNEKGDKKEKANLSLEKIKDCDEYSSSDTIVTQIDMLSIESSESLKTLVPEDLLQDVANSIEVLNVDNNKSDNDGWLTVKSRRLSRESKKQSKSHWVNRFHQPSATTSLPTLNIIESPKLEVSPMARSPRSNKCDRAKSEQPERFCKPLKVGKVANLRPKSERQKDPAMIRQKSDVTGLKTRSSRNKVTKKEKRESKNEGELTKNRLHSSLESLTTGLERSQERTEDAFDFDKWKAEFKSNFKYFDDDDQISNHNEILKSADPSEMSEIQEMTSQIEENERKISLALDFQSEVDQRKLCEEEDLLNRQIMELQQVSDIDLDTETDDTETDAEILCEDPSLGVADSQSESQTLGALAASLEEQYETALAGMSWAERVDTLVVLESLVARDPGRAQQLHAKLSQGIKRRGSLQDALRRLQAKQARAERQRRKYQTERAHKIHQLLARVEEVKVAKNQLIEEKRLRMERRLQKAAQNRDQHLKDIVRKAHDEEEKLREIAFIKQLEAENRRHEFLDQCRSHTTRLRQMRRERLCKLEQKAAREAAVGARRAALEQARRAHVARLMERRRERDARVEGRKTRQRQERDDAAREKAEGVKSRLSALALAAEQEATALRSRIRDKQDASQLRLDRHLQAIRERATGPPSRQPTTSECQDQKDEEQTEAERLEQERKERDRQKAIKKKARKVKQKLMTTIHEASENLGIPDLNLMPNNKMHKALLQLTTLLSPLLEDTQFERPTHVDEENDKNKKKNKSATKLVNGNAEKNNEATNNNINIVDNENLSNNNTIEEKAESSKRRNRKHKNSERDKPKLSKSSSVCSSLSDTSKASVRSEKRSREDIDPMTLERLLNELTRIVDKMDTKSERDKPMLSKSGSVCSSLSDTSKASVRSEKRSREDIDPMTLERLLNELTRIVDKMDTVRFLSDTSKASVKSEKRSREDIEPMTLERLLNELTRIVDKMDTDRNKTCLITQKLYWLKSLAYFVAVPAERDDMASQFTTKCLTTGVTLIARLVAKCVPSAAYLICSSIGVHLVKLLSMQLEKDVQTDPRETELAKQLSDCLAIAFDSVLCATRLQDLDDKAAEPPSKRGLDVHLCTMRSRAHMLTSYLCLSGCVARAEFAGCVRENVLALLGVCFSLTHPCDVDVGTERASAIQSLRCALGTSLCGARAEFCMLFAQDSDYQTDCDCFVRAARTADFLKTVAELDHHIIQESFGEGGWPLEFRAAVARLLQQHAPNDKEAPRTTALSQNNRRLDQKVSEKMVMDLLTLVGFVVVGNPQLQETICDGWSVVKTMCTLPANWLVSAPQCNALLPALIALAERPATAAVIAGEISMKMLDEFLESPEASHIKLINVIKQARIKKNSTKK